LFELPSVSSIAHFQCAKIQIFFAKSKSFPNYLPVFLQ